MPEHARSWTISRIPVVAPSAYTARCAGDPRQYNNSCKNSLTGVETSLAVWPRDRIFATTISYRQPHQIRFITSKGISRSYHNRNTIKHFFGRSVGVQPQPRFVWEISLRYRINSHRIADCKASGPHYSHPSLQDKTVSAPSARIPRARIGRQSPCSPSLPELKATDRRTDRQLPGPGLPETAPCGRPPCLTGQTNLEWPDQKATPTLTETR